MSTDMVREIWGLIVTGALAGAALVLAGLVGRFPGVPREATRKLAHVLCGLTAASFPLLFRSAWSVALVAAVFLAVMAWTRARGRLSAIHGVARRSDGALWFPVAIAVVFVQASGRPWLYLAAVLVLTVSDTLAALVGEAYGRHRYRLCAGWKSLEGSAAFLVSALLCVLVPLLLMSGLERTACLVLALYVAVLATLLEALSPAGRDNLLVPLGVGVALAGLAGRPLPELLTHLVALLAVIAGALALLMASGPRPVLRRYRGWR